ncbi:MAG: putative nucleotidyltransferase [Novosphingobium lindaniclasticum]|jgi:HEPN domain-containing protein|nr:putative nucleotidyltransferase [Novosphingobium lindaniclasticum]
MRSDLDHLPETVRADMASILRIIFAEFEDAIGRATQGWKRAGRVMKVLLHGEHARGAECPEETSVMMSGPMSQGADTSPKSYEIMLVVNDKRLAEAQYWTHTRDHLIREHAIMGRLSAPVELAVYTMTGINSRLSGGKPYFVDAVSRGLVLYELPGEPFAAPKRLAANEFREQARRLVESTFPRAASFLRMARFAHGEGMSNQAVFNLHQTAEHAYHTLLLAHLLYSPSTHRIDWMRERAEAAVPSIGSVWGTNDAFSRRCFRLLNDAYVRTRYAPRFSIQDDELGWLFEKIEALVAEVEALVRRRLLPPPSGPEV